MYIVYKDRGEGKTVDLIKESVKTGYTIVCFNYMSRYELQKMAKEFGYNIPNPISHKNFLKNKYCDDGIKGFLIDDIEGFLGWINLNIKGFSCSRENGYVI
jgi:hypothetical protein